MLVVVDNGNQILVFPLDFIKFLLYSILSIQEYLVVKIYIASGFVHQISFLYLHLHQSILMQENLVLLVVHFVLYIL